MGNLSAELPKGVYADARALPGNEFFLSILQLLSKCTQRETKNKMGYIHVSHVIGQLKTPNQYILYIQSSAFMYNQFGLKKRSMPSLPLDRVSCCDQQTLSDEQHRNYSAIYKKKGFQSGKWDFILKYSQGIPQFLTIF